MQEALRYDSHSACADWTMVLNRYAAGATGAFYCVENAGYQRCRSGYGIRRAGYHSFLLLVTLSGAGSLCCDGVAYTVKKGDIVFLDCMRPHTYEPQSKEWVFFWLHFNGANSREFHQYITGGTPVLRRSEADAVKLTKTIARLMKLHQTAAPSFDAAASECISGALHTLAQGVQSPSESTQSAVHIIAAVEYIRENYAQQNLSLDEIAASAHLSKYYFTKTFKSAAGVPPYEYVLRYRIEKSKELLTVTNLPVHSIAKQVGFKNPTCFIENFKKCEGYTPLKFRKTAAQAI